MDQQTRQALKHDQFVDTTNHGLEWASENRRSVIVTGTIMLAAILIVVCGVLFYNSRAAQASVAFGAAMQAYQAPLAEPGQPTPPGVKTFPTVADRAKAANAPLLDVANKYSITPDGKVARYFGGLTYMEAGENASAEATLKQVAGYWNADLSSLAKLGPRPALPSDRPRPPGHRPLQRAHRQAHHAVPPASPSSSSPSSTRGQNQPDARKEDLRPAQRQGRQEPSRRHSRAKTKPSTRRSRLPLVFAAGSPRL